MHFNDRDEIIALTPLWKGERLPDGRPKVEDKYLDALQGMTLEEVEAITNWKEYKGLKWGCAVRGQFPS